MTWLGTLDTETADELVAWLDGFVGTTPYAWLRQALMQERHTPTAYLLRPQLPSATVSSACKSRLRYLAGHDLIQPYEQPTRLAEGRAQTCWFLTRQGRKMVATAKGVPTSQLDWKAAGAYGILHLNHRLLLNDLRIAIHLACKQKGYQIRRWIDDNQLKRLLGNEKVSLRRPDQERSG